MKRWLLVSGAGVGLVVGLTLLASGWFERNPVSGAVVGMTLLFIILAALSAGMFYLGAAWTERQVKIGAQIATTTQDFGSRADERKTVALTHMAREMFRLGQQETNQPAPLSPPALPHDMADDPPAWLAPLKTFEQGEDDAPSPGH